ncbi:MAG TPA: LPS export ABC transporter periplasmic protein LptC [Spirochaetales bacterium]|nr:LPS export ABC transporter periplasmic protein LptC [Spirochaetales bacterium]
MQAKIITEEQQLSHSILVAKHISLKAHTGLLAAALALLLGALSACSMDYGPAISDTLTESIPDMVLVDFSRTIVENGQRRFVLNAARGEVYSSQNKTRLQDVRFAEYASDGSGTLVAEGRADSGAFWSDTESADLFGAVSFYSEKDGLRVESGNLRWDGKKRTLSSGGDTTTTLKRNDGSSLSGSGFQADAARRSFSFTRRVDGSLTMNPAGGSGGPTTGTAP